MNEIEQIANQINLAYLDGFWGGGSIRDLFRSTAASDAASYPIQGVHSIWEISLHLTSWHQIFRSRLVEDDDENNYQDWPTPVAANQANWIKTLNKLDVSHKELVDTVRNVKIEDLYKFVPNKKFKIYEMLYGISQHDQYHAGQVLLLKRVLSKKLNK